MAHLSETQKRHGFQVKQGERPLRVKLRSECLTAPQLGRGVGIFKISQRLGGFGSGKQHQNLVGCCGSSFFDPDPKPFRPFHVGNPRGRKGTVIITRFPAQCQRFFCHHELFEHLTSTSMSCPVFQTKKKQRRMFLSEEKGPMSSFTSFLNQNLGPDISPHLSGKYHLLVTD